MNVKEDLKLKDHVNKYKCRVIQNHVQELKSKLQKLTAKLVKNSSKYERVEEEDAVTEV